MSAHKFHRRVPRPLRAAVSLCLAVSAAAMVPGTPVGALTLGHDAGHTMGIFDPATLTTTDGHQIFQQICQGCHMPDARGAVGAGHYPALANNSALASRHYVAQTVLMGRRNMPAFGAKHAIGFGAPPITMTEEQMAAVINYVRTHFGNHYTDPVTAEEIKALDAGPPG